ncbi:MAG: tRNA dihydrouridine synthase DusB, partial [Proteobacteria bacterium]
QKTHIFERLGLPKTPLLLAPLAGVSDHPFRRTCSANGADLTYVEMISATAMLYESRRTFEMLKRHESEGVLGVQITGPSADQVGRAVAILDKMNFDTVDINMGCPVKKVVKTGCGSGILRDPERVYQTVKAAVESTAMPVTAKFRLGWDKASRNAVEVAQAIEAGGAAWMTIHGRTRADDYGVPVDLDGIREVKASVTIPVFGNGNIFQKSDADHMLAVTKVDGLMISRGALGNPWLFDEIRTGENDIALDDWEETLLQHLDWQMSEYGAEALSAAVCMRKHLLWYAKGWNGVKVFREAVNNAASLHDARAMVLEFTRGLRERGVTHRSSIVQGESDSRFAWDPKYDMDRQLDRGVGDDAMETLQVSEMV